MEDKPQRQLTSADRWGVVLGVLSVTLLAVVLGRVAQLQIAPSKQLQDYVSDRTRSHTTLARRGDILDARGRPLATSRAGYRVAVDPSLLEAPLMPKLEAISRVTGVNIDRVTNLVMRRVAQNETREDDNQIRYVRVGRALDSASLALAQAEALTDTKGVWLERVLKREALEGEAGELVAPFVGTVGIDHEGRTGAELAADQLLEHSNGSVTRVAAANGKSMWIDPEGIILPQNGENIRLSIDLVIQEILAEELLHAVNVCDAAGARGVVVDPRTGDVLAMHDIVRTPTDVVPFTSELASTERPPRFAFLKEVQASQPAFRPVRCAQDSYEPGSTFKPFMWAAVTERGLMQLETMVDTHDGRWRTDYGRPIRDVVKKDEQTWHEVLVNSSNIGMAQGVEGMTHEQARQAITKFGFGDRTNLRMPGEAEGLVTSAKNWNKYTQTSVAFGQEVAVTPLQLARAFSVFARNGEEAGTLPDLQLFAGTTRAMRTRVIPKWVAMDARYAMVEIGKNLESSVNRRFPDEPELSWPLFGKTGTAQVPRPDGRGYMANQFISSFVGAAPVNEPKLVVLIVVDDPGPERIAKRWHYGSATAAPAVRRVIQRTLTYLGEPIIEQAPQEDQIVMR